MSHDEVFPRVTPYIVIVLVQLRGAGGFPIYVVNVLDKIKIRSPIFKIVDKMVFVNEVKSFLII